MSLNRNDYKNFDDGVDWDYYDKTHNIAQPVSQPQTADDSQNVDISANASPQNVDISGHPSMDIVPRMVRAVKQLPHLAYNAVTHPVESAQDLGAGAAGGLQRFASTLGEAGQAIGDKMFASPEMQSFKKAVQNKTGISVPRPDIREELGLQGDNQFDLQKALASKNNNPLMQGIGQYLPAMAAGGTSLPGQVAANGAWGAIQGEPGERTQNGLESAALAAIPFAAGKGYQLAKAGIQYAKPAGDAAKFMDMLGGGSTNVEENLSQLTNKIKAAHDTHAADALADKKPVMDAAGKQRIDQLPGFNVEKVGKVFTNKKGDFTPENVKALTRAIKGYYKHGDLDKFTSKAEDIFGAEPSSEKQITKLVDMLSTREGSYLKNTGIRDVYDSNLKDLHDTFAKNPTLENADSLQSKLYEEIAAQKRSKAPDRSKIVELERARGDLKDDMKTFLKILPGDLQDKYTSFQNKWRENVIPYRTSNTLKAIIKDGEKSGVTDSQIKNEFEFPDKNGQKIAGDIGEQGRNHILYNQIINAKEGDVAALSKAILEAKRKDGYAKYVTPEHEEIARSLAKRAEANKKYENLKGITGGGLAGLAGGHPFIGMAAGAAYQHGMPAITKALHILKKK